MESASALFIYKKKLSLQPSESCWAAALGQVKVKVYRPQNYILILRRSENQTYSPATGEMEKKAAG